MTPTPQSPPARGFQALLAPAQWRELTGLGRRRALAAGERLLDQGGQSGVVYVLQEGRVRIMYTEPDGDTALIAIRGAGDVLGEYAQRDQGEHMAAVWTLEACVAAEVPSKEFAAFLLGHGLDSVLQRYMLAKVRQGAQRIWRAAHLQAEQRMALLFLEVIGAAPASEAPTVPMTQAQVAASLGVALSSVTKPLGDWRDRGIIRTVPAPMRVLDTAALARRANL